MREDAEDLDRRIAGALRRDTGAAARRARDLWPSVTARRGRKTIRRRRIPWAVPALAAAACAALLWTGGHGPVPDLVASSPPASGCLSAQYSPDPSEAGGVTLTASPGRYSPCMSSAFGIHITAADAQGNPVEGDWTASWGYFLPTTETEGGWKIEDPRDEVESASEAYWSFMSSDIPDAIQVRFTCADGVVVLALEKDTQLDYFVRVAAPQEGLRVVYSCWTQVLSVGSGIEWPGAAAVAGRAGMEEYCRDIFDRYVRADAVNGYGGGYAFLDAFGAYLTEEELSGVEGYAEQSIMSATPYEASSFDEYDLLLIPYHNKSCSIKPEVRQVSRTGDTLTVEAAALYPEDGALDTGVGYWLLAVQIPKGAADGAEIAVVFEDETAAPAVPGVAPSA